ncbi:hypothetical protein Taro_056031, partial [Colocasia esculenta]|nr:hypothetical protein [Colocasia esculenta]
DTSRRFQKTQLPDWDIRSTLDQVRSTLVPGSVDTVLGSVDTRSGLLTRWGGPSRFGCRGLEALAGYPFPLSLLLPFSLSLRRSSASPSPLCVFQARRRSVRGAVASWTLRG